MASGFHQVHLGKTVTLSEGVGHDGMIIFRSSEVNLTPFHGGTIDNTALNLHNSNDDYLLHISIRRAENAIVFNARAKDGNWGPEERVVLKGRFDGVNTTIAVYDHPEMFQILTNGRTARYFTKRFQGDVVKISYSVNPGQPQVFSDPVAIETYSNLAALVPGTS